MKISKKNMKDFERYLKDEEKAHLTVDKYVRDVGKLRAFSGGEKITKATLITYKKQLLESYSEISVNGIISSINCFFDFCEKPQLKLKTVKVHKKIFTSKEKELSKEEYNKLLKAAKKQNNKRLYYLMQTICSTGIRVSELKFITIESLKTAQAKVLNKGKSRIVMLPAMLCKILLAYAKAEQIKKGSVFVTKNGTPLDRSNIWQEMKSLCEAAGVEGKKVFPHNLRHLFARTYYSIQKDIVRLADILGHSNINTTRIYTIESGEIHRQHIEKLGLLLC